MNSAEAAAFLSVWGYPAYLVLFLASAVGSPITEDVLLLIGGYLVGSQVFSWPLTAAVSLVGVLATDSILYAFGRKLRRHSQRGGFIRRFIRPGRLRLATRWFARFGDRVVFFARFVPGTRLIVFVSAGVRGTPYVRFLALDALAALVWVPLLLLAGMTLGEQLGGLRTAVSWISDRVLWLVVAAAAWLVLRQVLISRTPGRVRVHPRR